MKKEREFLHELFRRRVFKVPFLEYFQNDKYLRNSLFQTFRHNRQAFLDIKLFKSLDEISKEIDDFHKIVLNSIEYDAKESSESVFKNIVNKLESIRIPKLTKAILNDFVNESENKDLVIAEVFEFNDFTFKKQYGISIDEAKRRYREIKRYADNYISDYLKDYNKREKELLNKFKHIGFLNYKSVIKELEEFDTTSQKLDYLKELKQKYYDKFESVKSSINEDEYYFFHNNYTTIWESIFGNYSLITPISIQEPVYNKYFKNGLREPEFTYWFLKYNAETVFNWQINDKEFQSKISSNLKDTFLNAELNQLNDFELKAKNLLLNKEIDIHKPHRNNYNFRKEIALLRVLDGNYYKENTTDVIGSLGSDEVQAYCKHILLKPYLEKLLKSTIKQKKGINDDYLITKQSITFNKNTRNYVYSEKEKSRLKLQVGNDYLEKYIDKKTEDRDGNYVFTFEREIDSKINSALKRNYNIFNEGKENYREVRFDNIGKVDIFRINGVEYLIEGRETQKQNFFVSVYNYNYAEKWLKYLNGLIGNFCFGTFSGIKEDIIEDAQKKRVANMDYFADNIEKLFNHCLDFHNYKNFEDIGCNTERHRLFRCISIVFWWKQEKERDVNKCIGSLITELEGLFITDSPSAFLKKRDFIILWIEKVIDITINNETNMFQWAYSPFMDDVFNLGNKIKELFSDDRISLKNSTQISNTSNGIKQSDNNFSHTEKLEIALELIGDNETSYTSIVYHHIKDVLNNKGLTYLQGRDILLDMKGAFSPEQNKIIIEPIIIYLERINSSNNSFELNSSDTEVVNVSAKYYAFYHWLLIKLGKESQFELNENGNYPATFIKDYARRKYKKCKSPVRFYQEFINTDITNRTATAKYLGKGYKEKIKTLFNNDAEVMSYLKKFPN